MSTVPSRGIFLDWLRTAVGWSQRARLVTVRSRAADLGTLRGWIEHGGLKSIVDRVYPLDQAVDAQRYLETKRDRGKVIVKVIA